VIGQRGNKSIPFLPERSEKPWLKLSFARGGKRATIERWARVRESTLSFLILTKEPLAKRDVGGDFSTLVGHDGSPLNGVEWGQKEEGDR
jgi:hypothetical protein